MNNKQLLKFKNSNNYLRHLVNLMSLNCNQFIYEGLPDTIPPEFLEFYLSINGSVAFGKVKELDNNDIYIATGGYNGNYNGYLPEEYTACVTGLGEISGKWYGDNKTIVVGKNNIQGSPEFDIPFTAEVLSQIDISERSNVTFSRMARLPYADDDKQKTAIESAIKSIIQGDPFAVATRGDIKQIFEEFLDGRTTEGEKFLDLVDPDKINGLQYLNQYHDNIMKRFLARRGYMVQTTSKLAQQTNAEIHGSDSYALLYPLEQLRQREKMIKEVNNLFGLSASVRFNDILAKVFKDYFAEPEETKTEEKTEETPEGKTEETTTEEVKNDDENN